MGIFDKLKGKPANGEEQEKAPKKQKGFPIKVGKGGKKEKAPKKGKKQKGLIESMGLNESVASMGISQLEQLVESNDASAVRSLDDGYTVIVITEEMLKEQGLDPKSDDFGSFANAISSEHIQSFLLKNDLEAGVLTIIPDQETLDVLDEFSVLEDIVYKWGVIPHDVEDESTVVQLNNGATLGDLNVIASEALDLVLKNGKIVTADQADEEDDDLFDETDEDEDDVEEDLMDEDDDEDIMDDEDEDEDEDVFTEDYGPTDIDFDDEEDVPDDVPDDLFDDEDDFEDDEDVFDYDDEPVEVETIDDLDDDLDDVLGDLDDIDTDLDDADEYELQTEEEGQAMITGVLAREFQNDELGVHIPADPFNHQFGDVEPILFNEKPNDNSSLAQVVAKMRQDANVQILNKHNANIQSLRSHYQNGLANAHDRLIQNLDHKNTKTPYGEKYAQINESKAESESRADEIIARERESLNEKYNERRTSYGERAKQEALSRFDDDYKEQHEKEKQLLGDEVYNTIQLGYDSELSDLYDERRTVAKRLFDQMTTQLLLELQKMFQASMEEEHRMYEEFSQRIDAYARENYTDEVLRAKALATQQRQHHEADEVRAEYEEMLTTKRRQLEEMERKANARIQELERSHSTTIKDTVADYKRQISRQEATIQELREDQRSMQDRLMKLDGEKDAEYANRLKTAGDTIESQRKQLEYEQQRTDKQGKQSIVMTIGMIVVGISLGLIMGFLIGAGNDSNNAPVANQQQPQGAVSMMREDTTELESVLDSAFNTLFIDDSTIVG